MLAQQGVAIIQHPVVHEVLMEPTSAMKRERECESPQRRGSNTQPTGASRLAVGNVLPCGALHLMASTAGIRMDASAPRARVRDGGMPGSQRVSANSAETSL
jgi:hypothetical protein